MGLGTMREENITILTPEGQISQKEATERYGNADFRVVRKNSKGSGLMAAAGIFKIFQKKPRIIADRCRKCGVCVESCPVDGKALDFRKGRNNPPVYDYRKCIRCFCCQEMCPHKAIEVK